MTMMMMTDRQTNARTNILIRPVMAIFIYNTSAIED